MIGTGTAMQTRDDTQVQLQRLYDMLVKVDLLTDEILTWGILSETARGYVTDVANRVEVSEVAVIRAKQSNRTQENS